MEKSSNTVSWPNIKKYAGEYVAPISAAIILATLGSLTSIIGPDKLSEITDLITEGLQSTIDLQAISRICILLALMYGCGALFGYGQGFIVATVTQKFSKKLREKVSEKINCLPLKYFDSHSQGDILSRVTNDLDTVGQSLNQSLGTLVPAVTLLIGCFFMMVKTNVLLTITTVCGVLGGFAMMAFLLKKSQIHFINQQQKLAMINGIAEETYSGHSVITTYSATEAMEQLFEETNESLYTSVWKAQFLSGMMQPLMGFIGNFGYVLVCVVGAVLALNNQITFGVIVAFMIYVRLFTQPLSQLAQAVSSLQSAKAALGRVFEFLDEEEMPPEDQSVKQLSTTVGTVEFSKVYFGYEPDKEIITNFSLEAQAGQKIAIVGPTGAGKTTIVNLLMKFYEVDQGAILIDGIPLKDLTRETVHNQFCMVLQDTWLFQGSIKENLLFNQKNISDEAVTNACKIVGIHHFIQTLPAGYETILDDSITLSAGQKQLLTIARALLKEAPMLILDEATSSVDTRTEGIIQAAMDRLMENRTSFVIAHRLSTIRDADLILVMDQGRIVEKGNHRELMKQNGFYADLYNSQFEK